MELVSLRSPLSYVETDTEVGAAASKLAVTEVCIKALLPIGKLTNLEKFNLTFVADVPSGEGAVVVELVREAVLNSIKYDTKVKLITNYDFRLLETIRNLP